MSPDSDLPFNGAFDFGRNVNNPLDTGYAYSNAALGVFNTYYEPSDRPAPVHVARNIEWFAQDNWKVIAAADARFRHALLRGRRRPLSKATVSPGSIRRRSISPAR